MPALAPQTTLEHRESAGYRSCNELPLRADATRGALPRKASVGEEVGDVEGDAGLGWVQGHVLEWLDQVVDLGFGVGVIGDGDHC